MVFYLQEPFKSIWRKGYLQEHPSGRKYISLFNSNEDRSIISYARYLMSIQLGYILPQDVEVDHKNNDKTDDRLDNLQVVTGTYNRAKEYNRFLEEEQVCYGYICAYCENPLILTEREVKKRIHCGVEMAFCSRSCAASYHQYQKKINASIAGRS